MKNFSIKGAAISAGIALLTGMLSSLLSGGQQQLYGQLIQPPFAPPPWLFGVVWPILYILMGIAAYLIYITPAAPADKQVSLFYYGAQLFVNFTWSIVFFRFQAYGLSVLVLAFLLVLVTFTMIYFFDLNRLAALLLLPYYLWLLVAYYLNIGVFLLNQ
ncbi:TspO/MBR family protein [Anaerocolumna sp. AGMB13020]|uniref:TspO/MBR family protein n=1 Tax=Anaerocolumna sp. AGMB13020 TaxID=3081750 RepID=UPI00295571C4|nr:TspO/MBR family protein [Anaerocolumna sp. AGMB13020]WOO37509.1 TspO/MBR family protein [Anaerocolumna sp. AGMB13020]